MIAFQPNAARILLMQLHAVNLLLSTKGQEMNPCLFAPPSVHTTGEASLFKFSKHPA